MQDHQVLLMTLKHRPVQRAASLKAQSPVIHVNCGVMLSGYEIATFQKYRPKLPRLLV
jgi:hypothetical protein